MKIKNKLVQTGYNIERLFEDKKIDKEAYEILKERNIETITLVEKMESKLNKKPCS